MHQAELRRREALKHAHSVLKRHREFGPASGANQAHGAPVHEEHQHRDEVLYLGALEKAAQEQDGHAGTLKLLAGVGQPVIAPAQNCLVAIPKACAELLDAVDQRRRHERAISDRDDLRLRAAGATVARARGPSAALMLAAKVEKAPTISEVER
jgi:hypothetical protein